VRRKVRTEYLSDAVVGRAVDTMYTMYNFISFLLHQLYYNSVLFIALEGLSVKLCLRPPLQF